jgi:hypothetical protein
MTAGPSQSCARVGLRCSFVSVWGHGILYTDPADRAGRWSVSFTALLGLRAPPPTGAGAGLDLGITAAANGGRLRMPELLSPGGGVMRPARPGSPVREGGE